MSFFHSFSRRKSMDREESHMDLLKKILNCQIERNNRLTIIEGSIKAMDKMMRPDRKPSIQVGPSESMRRDSQAFAEKQATAQAHCKSNEDRAPNTVLRVLRKFIGAKSERAINTATQPLAGTSAAKSPCSERETSGCVGRSRHPSPPKNKPPAPTPENAYDAVRFIERSPQENSVDRSLLENIVDNSTYFSK